MGNYTGISLAQTKIMILLGLIEVIGSEITNKSLLKVRKYVVKGGVLHLRMMPEEWIDQNFSRN